MFWFKDYSLSFVSVNCIKIILFSIIVFHWAPLSLISPWTNIKLSIFPGKYYNYSITAILILENLSLTGWHTKLLTNSVLQLGRSFSSVVLSKRSLKLILKLSLLIWCLELCSLNRFKITCELKAYSFVKLCWRPAKLVRSKSISDVAQPFQNTSAVYYQDTVLWNIKSMKRQPITQSCPVHRQCFQLLIYKPVFSLLLHRTSSSLQCSQWQANSTNDISKTENNLFSTWLW